MCKKICPVQKRPSSFRTCKRQVKPASSKLSLLWLRKQHHAPVQLRLSIARRKDPKAARADLVICCLQETKRKGRGSVMVSTTDRSDKPVKLEFHWSGYDRAPRDELLAGVWFTRSLLVDFDIKALFPPVPSFLYFKDPCCQNTCFLIELTQRKTCITQFRLQ